MPSWCPFMRMWFERVSIGQNKSRPLRRSATHAISLNSFGADFSKCMFSLNMTAGFGEIIADSLHVGESRPGHSWMWTCGMRFIHSLTLNVKGTVATRICNLLKSVISLKLDSLFSPLILSTCSSQRPQNSVGRQRAISERVCGSQNLHWNGRCFGAMLQLCILITEFGTNRRSPCTFTFEQ